MIVSASVGPSAYWYLTRGTGTVALILLTLSVALGVANARRFRTEQIPRFVFDAVHRNVSLLAVAFTAVHVVTSILDGFAPITLLDTIIPFVSAYRPLWLGFGTVAFDLLLALVVTSLLRRRFGYRAWRLTHWTAYACWPVALLHGFGTGSDVKFGWMLAISALCVAVVIAAALLRVAKGWPNRLGTRTASIVACVVFPVALIIWLSGGPLAKNWARRAGTPTYLLASSASRVAVSTGGNSGGSAESSGPPNFNARLTGTETTGQSPDGLAVVDLSTTVSGERLDLLHIRLIGQPVDGGGVQMTTSTVTLGSQATPDEYRGQVTALEGTDIAADLRSQSGSAVHLTARLQLNPGNGTVSGTVQVVPAGR